MTTLEPVRFSVELPYEQALAFAQFLKRAGHNDYLAFATNSDQEEAYQMLHAAAKLREAIAQAGISPR